MKRYKHASGAQKKKIKTLKEESLSSLPKIDSFFKTKSSTSPEGVLQETNFLGEASSSREKVIPIPGLEEEVKARSSRGEESSAEEIEVSAARSENEQTKIDSCFSSSSQYPTDIANFSGGSLFKNDEFKNFIITNGPCKPLGPFPKDPKQENRSFSDSYYVKTTKAGLKISRSWLCYSPKNDSVYCEACWLFADGKDSSWANGNIRDWKGLSKKILLHETSSRHLNACMSLNAFSKNFTVDKMLDSNFEKEANKWFNVLDRIVNVTLTLAGCNLAFRGHFEQIGKPNSGNFLAIIDLLSKFDPVLQELISKPTHQTRYLSPQVQNEIIQILSKKVEEAITNKIKTAQFFSIIMDTTQDITKIDQLSQVIRYVTISEDEAGKPISLNINESFLGFKKVTDQTGQGLEEEIIKSIEEKGMMLSKCRGQGYDGAANMSGVYMGVQSRIQKKQRTAKYIHCAAHNLNLVLNDAVSEIQENKIFFDTVEQIYVFFSQSIKRWELLRFTSHTLKRLCPTRWSSRVDSLKALRYNYVDVAKALTKIALNSSSSNEKTIALSLKKKIEDFDFVLLVVMHLLILEATNLVTKGLQSSGIDLSKAVSLLKNSQTSLISIRENYDTAVLTATIIAQQWGVATNFRNKRSRKVKKYFDELAEDERLSDPHLYFKTNIFYGTLDIVINQITFRFQGMNEIANSFSLLSPEFLSSCTDEELNKAAKDLAMEYSEDFTNEISHQFLCFRSALKTEFLTKKNIKEVAELLLIENYSIACSVPDVCTAYFLFLTLPVTVAKAERSFSKLKLIKNYLRSAMSQERLSGLSLLSIENDTARSLDLKEVIKLFASQNARRERKFKTSK